MEIVNIIIKTPSFIGDSIMTLPTLELLKQEYPIAKFTIVCPSSSKDLFRNKGIDKIIVDDTKKSKNGRMGRTFSLITKMREEHYDLGVLFHNTFLDALMFKLSKIDTIIGYENENRKILLDFWLKIDRSRHYINHYANLVNQYLGNKYKHLPEIKLYSEPSKLLMKESTPIVGFVLGGKNKDTRYYPQNLSIELFNLLKKEDIKIVLLGDRDDSVYNSVYEAYLSKNNVNYQNLSGKTNIAEFIDIIATLDLLVSIDTSAMHIAAAVKTNFVVILGKGTSAFSIVRPKVSFGSYIFQGESVIQDKDMIYEVNPSTIKEKIMEKLINERE